jgi:hypothetical protein
MPLRSGSIPPVTSLYKDGGQVGVIALPNLAVDLNLTPFCRQEEKPVSSGEKGELVWMKRENERSMIGSSRSML